MNFEWLANIHIDWGIIGLIVSIFAIVASLVIGPFLQVRAAHQNFLAGETSRKLAEYKELTEELLTLRFTMTNYNRTIIEAKIKKDFVMTNEYILKFNAVGIEFAAKSSALALYLCDDVYLPLQNKIALFEKACLDDSSKENLDLAFWENPPAKAEGHMLDILIVKTYQQYEKSLLESTKPKFKWFFWKY